MMDVERVVAKRLMDATGIQAVVEIPAEGRTSSSRSR